MRKEFTQEKRAYFHALIRQIRADDARYGSVSGVVDAVEDALGAATIGVLRTLGLSDSLRSVSWYQKLVYDTCNTTEAAVDQVFENVCGIDTRYVSNTGRHKAERCEPVKRYMHALESAIDPSAGALTATRVNRLLVGASASLPSVSPAYANADADNGYFGGDQGGYAYGKYQFNFDECAAIVRSYPQFSDYTDEEIRKFLANMNSEGCSYVAWCNTVFAAYQGREDEFQKRFGFPMYDAEGRPNFGLLIVDFYCAKDDRSNSDGTYVYDGQSGHATTQAAILWESYLLDKGIKVKIDEDLRVTPENYAQMAKGGQLIVATWPIRLRDESGKLVDTRNGGHTMAIEGVTDDGLFIVSSWGKKYYIDPNDYGPGMTFVISRIRY